MQKNSNRQTHTIKQPSHINTKPHCITKVIKNLTTREPNSLMNTEHKLYTKRKRLQTYLLGCARSAVPKPTSRCMPLQEVYMIWPVSRYMYNHDVTKYLSGRWLWCALSAHSPELSWMLTLIWYHRSTTINHNENVFMHNPIQYPLESIAQRSTKNHHKSARMKCIDITKQPNSASSIR